MSTAAAKAPLTLNAERRFYSATALAGLIVTIAGFIPSWILMRWFDAEPLPWIVHLHGILFLGWIVLYLAQTTLIATGQRELHRQVGIGGVLLGAAVVVLGVVISIEGARRGSGGPHRDELAFIANPLTNIFAFAVLLIAAIVQRKRAAYHKRLMLLTMLPILTTPLARISRMLGFGVPGPVGGMLLANLFLVALLAYDLRSKGKVHPATLWGGLFLIVTEVLRVVIASTPAWRSFAAWLIG